MEGILNVLIFLLLFWGDLVILILYCAYRCFTFSGTILETRRRPQRKQERKENKEVNVSKVIEEGENNGCVNPFLCFFFFVFLSPIPVASY